MNDSNTRKPIPKLVDLTKPRPAWLAEAQTVDENIWANRYIVAAVAFQAAYNFADTLRKQYEADVWSFEMRTATARNRIAVLTKALRGWAIGSADTSRSCLICDAQWFEDEEESHDETCPLFEPTEKEGEDGSST